MTHEAGFALNAGGRQLELEFGRSFLLTPPELKAEIRKRILSILAAHRQPGAGELLAELEKAFDWRVRQLIRDVVEDLACDKDVRGYQRGYIETNLSPEALAGALRGDNRPSKDFQSGIDDLLRKSLLYRSSSAFHEAIEFAAKFRNYAPFNNLLVKVQNPACGYYATEKDWGKNFGRRVKEDARPMLILAPMHSVMLVYDLDSTEGPPLPERFEEFATTRVEGAWSAVLLERTLENAERDRIQVKFKRLSTTLAGFATTDVHDGRNKMRIVVDEAKDGPSRYSVLCHELAHIYLGHLGGDRNGWWPSRINLTHHTVEIEAEAVAYIVSIKAGLKPASAQYVGSHLGGGRIPESVSLELIAKVAGRIEEMGNRTLPPRKGAEGEG